MFPGQAYCLPAFDSGLQAGFLLALMLVKAWLLSLSHLRSAQWLRCFSTSFQSTWTIKAFFEIPFCFAKFSNLELSSAVILIVERTCFSKV